MATTPAPGDLELIRSFVNTWDEEDKTEVLDTAEHLRTWLAEHRLLAEEGAAAVGDADLRRAVDLREALRALLAHNAGLELDPEASRTLDEAAGRARLTLGFGPGGQTRLAPHADGVDGALGRLLAIVAAAMQDGTWQRLKVCLAGDCLWGYYDTSRNRSSVWCDMSVCGNRQKVRAFRARQTRA